jgi:hypothetical protein
LVWDRMSAAFFLIMCSFLGVENCLLFVSIIDVIFKETLM